MTEILTAIITTISPAALPIVVVIIYIAYLHFKFNNLDKDREVTKQQRDIEKDELDKRLTLVEHDVSFMKEQNSLFADKLDRILDELTGIKVALAKKAERG